MQKEKEQILRSAATMDCSPPFHKEGERGWIVNIIGGIKPTLQAEDLGSAKLPP